VRALEFIRSGVATLPRRHSLRGVALSFALGAYRDTSGSRNVENTLYEIPYFISGRVKSYFYSSIHNNVMQLKRCVAMCSRDLSFKLAVFLAFA